jgi:hypothetical protein
MSQPTLRARAAAEAARRDGERTVEEARRQMERAAGQRNALVVDLKRLLGVEVEPALVFFYAAGDDQPFVEVDRILFTRHVRRDNYSEMLLVAWRCPACDAIAVNFRDEVRDLETLHHALPWLDKLEADPSTCPHCTYERTEAAQAAAAPAPEAKPRKLTTEERLAQAIGEIVDAHIDAHVSAYHAEEA